MKYIEFCNEHSLKFQILYGIFNIFLWLNIIDIIRYTKCNEFFFLFFLNISQTICGVGLIVEKLSLSEGHNNQNIDHKNINEKKYEVIKKEPEIKNIMLIYLLLLICSVVGNGGFYFSLYYFYENHQTKTDFSFWSEAVQLISSLFLCKLLLAYKFQHHKIVSTIIIFILSGSVQVWIIFLNQYKCTHIIYDLISGILTSIQEVLEKYLMQIKYQSAYKLLFIEGIFGTIITGIVLIISIQLHPNSFDLFKTKVPQIICYICLGVIYQSFRIIINMKYTPTHRLFGDSFLAFASIVPHILFVFYALNYSFMFILHFFVCFLILVYNEFIILHFCGLDVDTKKKILERVDNEEHEINLTMKAILNNEKEEQANN